MQMMTRWPSEPFGAWLAVQRDRGDQVDQLARRARADRDFPVAGDVDAVRGRLRQLGVDEDALRVLDHAELDWASL